MSETGKILEGKRIVITRALQQSESIVEMLHDSGATAVLLPMVAFAPPDDPAPLDGAIRNLQQFDWMFLTSQNALRAMQERCAVRGISLLTAMAGVNVAAVGPMTAAAAELAGLKIAYVAKKHQGVALAEELSASVRGKKVLLPRSDRANHDLIEALAQYGAIVTEVVAYKTLRPTAEDERKNLAELQKGVDAILFFSPSAVHHMQDMLGGAWFAILSNSVVYTAIGPLTEKALRETGVQRIVTSEGVQTAAVMAALEEFFSNVRNGLPAGAK